MLNTVMVASDIPLLLSRKAMKKANMTLDFKSDHAIIFDQSIQLLVTKPGHYAIPINPYKNVTLGVNRNVTLKQQKIINQKQYSYKTTHPSPKTLLKLLNSAGDPWQSDEELKKLIKKVNDESATCKMYQKTQLRLVVGLPMATSFQECTAMDLKFYIEKILLHLIDH